MNVFESDDSGDESGVKPKRTKKSKKNTIESDSETDSNQDKNSCPLINFVSIVNVLLNFFTWHDFSFTFDFR